MADSGGALLSAMQGTYPPDEMDGLSAAEHLAQAHHHVESAGVHADLAREHLARLEPADADSDGDAGHGDTDSGADGRSMPASAQPQGSAQARGITAVSGGTGAARAWRQATGRR